MDVPLAAITQAFWEQLEGSLQGGLGGGRQHDGGGTQVAWAQFEINREHAGKYVGERFHHICNTSEFGEKLGVFETNAVSRGKNPKNSRGACKGSSLTFPFRALPGACCKLLISGRFYNLAEVGWGPSGPLYKIPSGIEFFWGYLAPFGHNTGATMIEEKPNVAVGL